MTLSTDRTERLNRQEPSHFAFIDAVRGLAFLSVLTLHSALSVGPFYGRNVLAQGGYGVQLFFLASAITLCFSMASRQNIDKYPVLYFFVRRLFRIAPLFWLAILFYWIFPGVMPSFWLSQWAPDGVRPAYFALTALFLHGWHPYTFNSIVPGGWSIAVEMTFYLFFPFLFRFLSGSLKRTVIMLLAAVFCLKIGEHIFPHLRHYLFPGVPANVWGFFINLWFPSQLPVFLVGFLACEILRDDSVKRVVKDRFWALFLFLSCAMLLLSILRGESGFLPNLILVVLILAAMIIVMSGGATPWLVNPLVCYIGKISYSCYLVHFGALGLTLKMFHVHLSANLTSFDSGHSVLNFLAFAKILAITLVLTVVVSTVTLHLIENPGIALGRRIIRSIGDSSRRTGNVRNFAGGTP
jgi:peptidoglycan/LPS O-acetylase OafA/YrhL